MLKRTPGILDVVGRGHQRQHGQGDGNRGDPEMTAEAPLQRLHVVAHGPSVLDDAARPFEDPLALGGEADEARRALYQHGAQRILELLDAGGEARLTHAAALRRLAEVAFARQRQQILELVDHARSYRAGGPVGLGALRRAGGRAAAKPRARTVPLTHVLELKSAANPPPPTLRDAPPFTDPALVAAPAATHRGARPCSTTTRQAAAPSSPAGRCCAPARPRCVRAPRDWTPAPAACGCA